MDTAEEIEKLKKQVQELAVTVKKLSAQVEEHQRKFHAARNLPRFRQG